MGLSNEERLAKMTWAIRALTNLGYKLGDHREFEDYGLPWFYREPTTRLTNILDGLWHQYLGRDSNGIFWLTGGQHNNPIKGDGSPWACAIGHQISQIREQSEVERRMEEPVPTDMLTIKRLLPGEFRGLVYDVFAWTEQLAYALRRYDDSLLSRFPDLNKSISDIHGALFEMFHKDPEYAKAYLAHRLLEWVYEDYDLRPTFEELYWHYKLNGVARHDMAQLVAWDRWVLKHKDTKQNRVVLALRMMGAKFDSGQLQKLIDSTRGMGIRKRVIRREVEKCRRLRESPKEDYGPLSKYREEQTCQQAAFVHGFDAFEWVEVKFAQAREEKG